MSAVLAQRYFLHCYIAIRIISRSNRIDKMTKKTA